MSTATSRDIDVICASKVLSKKCGKTKTLSIHHIILTVSNTLLRTAFQDLAGWYYRYSLFEPGRCIGLVSTIDMPNMFIIALSVLQDTRACRSNNTPPMPGGKDSRAAI
jgi:hypothetical protein